jgi:hypothetical protein
MGISIRSEGVATETTAQTIECPAPGTIVDGDILRIVVGVDDDVVISVPDFTEVGQVGNDTALDGKLGVYIKEASSESGTYTVNIAGGVDETINVQCTAFADVDTAQIEDSEPIEDAYDTASGTYDPPGITTNTDLAFVESCMFSRGASLTTPTVPTGYTDSANGGQKNTNSYLGAAYKEVTSAGAEDPGEWTGMVVTVHTRGITWAIRPAVGGGGGGIMPLRHHNRMLGAL